MLRDHPRLRRNNFDLLRLLFAGTVCLAHASQLSGEKQLKWISTVLSSKLAVEAFFIISGFLIFMSYERSSSTRAYISKRVRRIYPAYFVVVMLCALSLWAVSSLDLEHYVSFDWLKYVIANLAFLNFIHPTLPGVFESNRISEVNGALWTLKVEVMFYAIVPVIVFLFRRFGQFPVLVTLYLVSVAYVWFMTTQAEHSGSGLYSELARQLPGQLAYFMAGAFFYYYLPLFERRLPYFAAFAALALLVSLFYPIPLVRPFAIAIAVAFFGLYLYLGDFGKYGDFSYGVYILHFPIIQVLLYANWFKEAPGYYIVAVVFITLVSAVAMWHFVEKWFLFRTNHYVRATNNPELHPKLVLNRDAADRRVG